MACGGAYVRTRRNQDQGRKALPKASYIAFTGTPLLKDEKTANKFGPIVHAYTMQRAVEDGAGFQDRPRHNRVGARGEFLGSKSCGSGGRQKEKGYDFHAMDFSSKAARQLAPQ